MNCAWYFIADKAIAVWKNTAVATAVLGNLGAKVTFSMSCTFMNVKWQATVSELQNVVFHWASDGAKHLSVPALLGHSHCILHNSPWKKSCVTAQGSADRAVLALEIPNLKLLLCSLHFLFWRGSSGSTGEELQSLQSPPARRVSFWASLTWSALLVLTVGGSSLHCSCDGLPAQNRFTHLHDCHCPFSLILGSHNVFTVLLIFPGPGSGVVPECITRPGSVWLFCSQQSVSKPLFFPSFPVFLSLLCSLQCLSDHFTRVASVISHFKTCEDLFTPFLPSGIFQQTQQRNWHHHSLDFLCHLSPEKQQQQHVWGWGQQQLSGLWGALTHPGCCFGNNLQPTMDFKFLWPCSELLPYLTKVEWVTDETWLLNVSSLGQGLSSL